MISVQAASMPLQDLPAELTAGEIGARRRLLDHGERDDQIGIQPQLDSRNLEVVEGARGLHAVIRIPGHVLDAQKVVLLPRSRIGHDSAPVGKDVVGAASIPTPARPAGARQRPVSRCSARRASESAAPRDGRAAPGRLLPAGGVTEFRRTACTRPCPTQHGYALCSPIASANDQASGTGHRDGRTGDRYLVHAAAGWLDHRGVAPLRHLCRGDLFRGRQRAADPHGVARRRRRRRPERRRRT